MSRYIDADALDDLITQLNSEGRHITRAEYKMIDNILFEMPTADVVEVKHGEWIPVKEADADYNQEYECSECHAHDDHAISQVVPYCWYCGARMI